MTRRAYLRLDPDFFERKVVEDRYPLPAALALISTLCLSEDQPQRGRFRNAKLLRVLLDGDPPTGLGKWVPYLIEHGDLIAQDRGVLYIDGWDEWQEGDWKVAERVARIRARKSGTATVTPGDTPDVTVSVTPDVTVDVTPPRYSGERLAEGEGTHVPSGGGSAPYLAMKEVTQLSMDRVEFRTKQELDRLIDQRGPEAVAVAIREVAERIPTQPPAARQVVYEAVKFLEPFSNGTKPKAKGHSNLSDLQAATETV
jgi:hypothetical protein